MTSPFSVYQGSLVYVTIDQTIDRPYHREGTLLQYDDNWIEIDTGGTRVLIPIARIIEISRRTL